MPLYAYRHPDTGEEKEILQSMNDEHVHIDEFGVEWKRVFSVPHASIDSNIDPFSQRQFADSTGGKKGTFGDMFDYSKEMSERRAEKAGGVDPVKKKYFEDYSKKTGGKKHIAQSKTYESKSVKVDYD